MWRTPGRVCKQRESGQGEGIQASLGFGTSRTSTVAPLSAPSSSSATSTSSSSSSSPSKQPTASTVISSSSWTSCRFTWEETEDQTHPPTLDRKGVVKPSKKSWGEGLTCCLCSADLMCSTNFRGVLKWRSHTGQKGRHSRLHIWRHAARVSEKTCCATTRSSPFASVTSSGLFPHLVLVCPPVDDDITAKMSLTGVTPVLSVGPTPSGGQR